jgi:hypothetical protein
LPSRSSWLIRSICHHTGLWLWVARRVLLVEQELLTLLK